MPRIMRVSKDASVPNDKPNVDDIMICKITARWQEILQSEYLNSGAVSINFWTPGDRQIEERLLNLPPGSLVLLVCDHDDGRTYILGGGFFFRWTEQTPAAAWQRFGVRNGAATFEELTADIRSCGGNPEGTIRGPTIDNIFLFPEEDVFTLPEVVRPHFENRSYYFLGRETPLAMYLNKFVKLRRADFISKYGAEWRGIYSAASTRNSRNYAPSFRARVFAAYNYRCAVTRTTAGMVLNAAHIQPFYDNTFQHADNGILLRTDIYRLFYHGYITAYYDDDVIRVRISGGKEAAWGADYAQYDGIELAVPEDRALWPRREYLSWHNKFCFEHWLHLGGTHV